MQLGDTERGTLIEYDKKNCDWWNTETEWQSNSKTQSRSIKSIEIIRTCFDITESE